MAQIELSRQQQRELEEVVRRHRDARVVKRAQALLWLDEGVAVMEVAQRLKVSRQSIYGYIGRVEEDQGQNLTQRLEDQPRCGRPAYPRELVHATLEQVMERDPRDYGHASAVWTVPLLRKQVQQDHQQEVSPDTVRRALKDLDYRYKGCRYVLARRSTTWQQAKGGCSGA